jgi:tetratricopeptide (TPR) repeat protein
MLNKLIGTALLGLLYFCGLGAAQEAKPNALYFDSVENNDEAASSLAKAKDCAAKNDWVRAIKFYQYLAKEYTRLRAPIYPNVYVSMNEHCLREMSRLPREAIKTYREDMGNDAVAGAMFERAMKSRDFELLQKVADEYFLTAWGDKATKLLADFLLEQGRFADALEYYNKILEIYPDTKLDKPTLYAITAVLRAQMGQPDRAKEILDKLSQVQANPVIDFAGRKLSVSDFQKQMDALASSRSISKSYFAEGELSGASVRWSRYFFRDFKEADIELIKREYDRLNSRTQRMGPRYLPSEDYSAVWREGKVLFPRNGELYIIDGLSGEVVNGIRADQARVGAFVSAPNNADLRDNVVFFNGRAPITNMWFQQFASRRFYASETIVGYDLNKKAPLLLTDSPQPDSVKEQLTRMARASAPLLRGDNMYSAFIIPYDRGQESYVCGFSSITGKPLWRPQFVMQYNVDGYSESMNLVNKADIQEREGKLYLLTNGGVAACFNAADGHLNWLTVYPAKQISGQQAQAIMMERMNNPTASAAPTVNMFVTERALVLAPKDSDQIIVLDRVSGRMFNSFFHEGKTLVGVD